MSSIAPLQPHLCLEAKRHRSFFLRHLHLLPRPYTSADSQRMTLAYFCLSGLDLLGGVTQDAEREDYREWIWNQQMPNGGFRGSPYCDEPSSSTSRTSSHLAMTYTALLNLAILRDDFARLNRTSLVDFLSSCQMEDGSFSPSPEIPECDPRFTFCAFAICWIIDDWTAIDVKAALAFLETCRSYDGAFGQGPHQESHGGSTYCVLASYSLSDQLHQLKDRKKLIRWLLARQSDWEADDEEDDEEEGEDEQRGDDKLLARYGGGFNGRLGKRKDSCYSFWCGASLSILSSHHLLDEPSNISHLMDLQTPIGGIRKTPHDPPDLMHSYLALAALALHLETHETGQIKIEGLLSSGLDPSLNVSLETKGWIVERLHLLRRCCDIEAE